MSAPRENTIAFVTGKRGEGKSQLLHDVFVSQAPRVLSLDSTGETVERNPDAIPALGFPAVVDALRMAADYPEWHIAAAVDRKDIPALFALLVPDWGTGRPSYAASVGGMALECGEIDVPAPASGIPEEVAAAWARGRHHRLSIFAATRRPFECARIVSSQADHVIAFRQHEPRDVQFLAETISRPVAALVPKLPKYWHVWYSAEAGLVYVRDHNRHTRAVMQPDGLVTHGSLDIPELARP